MDIEKIIREYIGNLIHMSLATCKDDKPWICEVHFSFDEDLNFYFTSRPERRHSEEIKLNPNVSGNIVSQHEIGQKVRAVYFEGKAERLENVNEEHPAYQSYCRRFNTGPEILGHQFYKIKVNDFFLFDNQESDLGMKHHLPWSR